LITIYLKLIYEKVKRILKEVKLTTYAILAKDVNQIDFKERPISRYFKYSFNYQCYMYYHNSSNIYFKYIKMLYSNAKHLHKLKKIARNINLQLYINSKIDNIYTLKVEMEIFIRSIYNMKF